MGQAHSRCSSGKQLIQATVEQNTQAARQILSLHPEASCYSTCIDRNSPLLVAAGRGHARMVQAILEAAVLSQGLTRAKKRCINHSNSKGQSALMLACISGHAQCVEVLVCNGGSPLVLDNARHNSALHWAASCCRADCVGRLLGSGAIFQMQSGQQVAIADIPCFDEDNSTLVKFIDRHNGWGLTALHLATYKGSSSTVRALLRHGASVSARSIAPTLAISPSLQPPGSTALHFAAAAEDVSLVLVLLEAQVSRNEPDSRRATNANGDRPIDLAPSSLSVNPLLIQLLDPAHALSLNPGPRSGIVINPGSSLSRVITREGLRQHQALLGLSSGTGFRGNRRGAGADQQPHVTLGAHLQRLKLVLSLEAFALQQQLAAADSNASSGSAAAAAAAVVSLLAKQQQAKQQQVLAAGAGDEGEPAGDDAMGTAPAAAEPSAVAAAAATTGADVAVSNTTLDTVRTASSGLSSSSTPAEICPSSSGDDTRAVADAQQQQQQQQRQNAAQLAAQQVRLKTLQYMMAAVDSMLALLPTSAVAPTSLSSGSASPRSIGPITATQQQQQQQQRGMAAAAHGSSTSGAAGGAAGSWGLLGGLLARSSTGSHLHPAEDIVSPHSLQQQQQRRVFGRRGSGRSSDGTGSDSSPAAVPAAIPEEVLAAYITPSMLSSLAAVTKLFVGASSLSGQQQEQQQQGMVGGGGCGSTARWAEQEHALMLMKGILKTLRKSLEAAQQAAAAAASRSALRQRHQQQLAHLLGPDRPVHSHSLRRALLGERLADQGRIRFGASSGSSSRHDTSMATAYLGAMSPSWGIMDTPVSSLPAASGQRHSSRRSHRSRRLRGEDGSDGAGDSSRRHHRHHSRHHRSGRRRTPRAVDLPMNDLSTDPASSRTHRRGSTAAAAATGPIEARSRSDSHLPSVFVGETAAAVGDSGNANSSGMTPEQQQQQQQYLAQLAGILGQHSSNPAGQASEIQPSPATAAAAAAGAVSGLGGSAAAQQAGYLPSTSSSSSGSQSGAQQEEEFHDVILPGDDAAHCDDVTHGSVSDSEDDAGVAASLCSSLDATTCAICMDCTAGVSVSRCSHSLCLQCAYQLCYKAKGLPLCPFCRQPIDGFDVAAAAVPGGC